MSPERLGLRLRFALFFAALGLGGVGFFVGGLTVGYLRMGGAPDGFVTAGVIGAVGLLGLTSWVAFLFDDNVARPILALASDLHSRAVSGISARIDAQPARYLGALAPASQALHDALEEARASEARSVAEQTARMARDKSLLEAVIRDLAEPVVVLSSTGQILLFNQSARRAVGALGLGRNMGHFLEMAPVWQAADRSQNNDTPAWFLTATDTGRMLRGAVSPVGQDIGLVMILHDATQDLRNFSALDGLLSDTLEQIRRPVSAVSALLDVLNADPGPEKNPALRAALDQEMAKVPELLNQAAARQNRITADHWPLRPTQIDSLFAAVSAAETRLDIKSGQALRVTCDGFAIATILHKVCRALLESGTRHGLQLAACPSGDEVLLEIGWSGEGFAQADLERLQQTRVAPGYGAYTMRDALTAHRSGMWLAGRDRIVLPLAPATGTPEAKTGSSADFYDFGLPQQDQTALALPDMTYVVFDTETTGLDAARDAVVQIAGVRVVAGRVLRDDTFEALVQPGRPIPPSATAIHRITNDMVAGAPEFAEVMPAFTEFARDAVLVAHHAAFDMGFLRREDPDCALMALCTARLSEALDPHETDHTLDALAARYDVPCPDDLRHTALGDARVTAEVFLKMIPRLKSMGVTDLKAALDLQALPED